MRRAFIAWPLLVMLVTGCTLCARLDSRRSTLGATPSPEIAIESVAPEPTPDAAAIERALGDSDWQRRMSAAFMPAERDDIPLDRRVTMLAEALAREFDVADAAQPSPFYLTIEGAMRLRFVRSLGDLGQDGIPVLRKLAERAGGDVRTSYLIALGYMGDQDVAPALREALQTSEDPVIRMDAARALGVLGDREAIPVLRQALDDPYMAEGLNSLGTYRIYPVRVQAAGALIALGLDVEVHGHTYAVRP